MWVLGGVFSAVIIYALLRPSMPELVKLEDRRFVYDTGRAPVNCFNPYWMMKKQRNANFFSMFLPKRKIHEFPRLGCPEFVIEGLGDEHRLRFDGGADRVTIGEFLKEPEREWLGEVLETWRAD